MEERDEKTTKAKPHYRNSTELKKFVPAVGYAKSKTKNILVQIEIGLPRTSDHLKIWLGRPRTGIVYVAPGWPGVVRIKVLRWDPYQT